MWNSRSSTANGIGEARSGAFVGKLATREAELVEGEVPVGELALGNHVSGGFDSDARRKGLDTRGYNRRASAHTDSLTTCYKLS